MNTRIAVGGTMVVLALTLAACRQDAARSAPVTTTTAAGQSTAEPAAAADARGMALVRVVHAIPAGSTVDLFADDERLFEDIGYKTVTPYREVDGQRYSFALRPAGMAQGDPLVTNSEGLDDGDYYTVFALPGDGTTARLRVVEDHHTLPRTGKARLRVVHASNDAGDVDIFASAAAVTAPAKVKLFSGVAFEALTDYNEIDPVAGTVELRPKGDANTMLTLPDMHFDAGKSYTLVIVGRVKTAPRLDGFVIEDSVADASRR